MNCGGGTTRSMASAAHVMDRSSDVNRSRLRQHAARKCLTAVEGAGEPASSSAQREGEEEGAGGEGGRGCGSWWCSCSCCCCGSCCCCCCCPRGWGGRWRITCHLRSCHSCCCMRASAQPVHASSEGRKANMWRTAWSSSSRSMRRRSGSCMRASAYSVVATSMLLKLAMRGPCGDVRCASTAACRPGPGW